MSNAAAAAIEVIEPGLLLTVQDLGRRGSEHLGVPRAGAADARSLVLANRLAGASDGAAALEATLLGPRIRALRDVTIGLAGADLAPVAQPGDRLLAVGRAHRLGPGEILECTEPGDEERGCRLYLAVDGGIDVPFVLGSRSTSLVGGFGGLDGRPLRAGDVLAARETEREPVSTDGTAPPPRWWDRPIGVLPGPESSSGDGAARLAAFVGASWTVANASDRRGLRLDADDPALAAALATPGDRPSFGVVPGAIQLTPSGQPIVLMPDGGVTGGYPVIAIVASADLPALGQLVPGASVRFETRPASKETSSRHDPDVLSPR